MVAERTLSQLSQLDPSEQKALLWLIPKIGSRTSASTDDLSLIISQLIMSPYFPMQNDINDYVLQKSDFLKIEDKYLLMNYITNYTHFAQGYVNDGHSSVKEFANIIEDAKESNVMPQAFIDYIISSYYSDYAEIDKQITKGEEPQRDISKLKDENQQAILYARLYVKGNPKFKKYYEYTIEKNIVSEMLLYDKISYHYERDNFSKIASYIYELPPTLHNSEVWWDIGQKMVRDLIHNNYKNAAYQLLSKIQLRITNQNYLRKEMLSGAVALLIDRPNHAYEHFYNFYSNAKSLDDKSQGAYFIAQSYFKMGNKNAYRYWLGTGSKNTTTFYGSRALDELFDASPDLILGSNQYLTPAWYKRNENRRSIYKKYYDEFVKDNLIKNQKNWKELPQNIVEMIKIAEILKSIGYIVYAKEFIVNVIKNVEDLSVMKSLLGFICEEYNKYICIDAKYAAETIGFIDLESFKVIESDDVHEVIKSSHLPLLHAIIKKESNFNMVARSRVGAQGVMQVMPQTARFVCAKHGIEYNSNKLQNDPGYNIRLGTLYLNDLLERYNGSYARTLAAYNAGYGNLQKWEKAYIDAQTMQEMILMIELIPFTETRGYVKKTLTWEGIYSYIFSFRKS